jgi:hypothetical protein
MHTQDHETRVDVAIPMAGLTCGNLNGVGLSHWAN